jgi:CAAX prenyl protease-like protein
MNVNDEAAPLSAIFNRAAMARIVPFLIFLGFIALADLLERQQVSAAALRWIYPVQFLSVGACLALYWRHYTELHTLDLNWVTALIAIGTGVLVFVLWISLTAGWMTIGTAHGYNPTDHGEFNLTLLAFRLAGAALLVPVMEELFWRSFLLRWIDRTDFSALDPRAVSVKALAISIVLFGVEHQLWLAGIVAGIAYSALYVRYRTLWIAVLAHAVTNGLLGCWIVATHRWEFW